MSKIFLFLVFGIFFFLFPQGSFAVSFTISSSSQTISKNDEISINILINDLTSCIKCYLQTAFTSSLTNPKYLGFTSDNSGNWYKYLSSPPKETVQSSFFSFEPIEGNWSGVIKAKIDIEDTDY